MASTIGPIDAGIVDALENAFEKETGIRVRHVGAGTGATLKMAEGGQMDLVMVHAKALEEKFVADGFGTERFDCMYNDFVILGPENDPAGIKGMKKAGEALNHLTYQFNWRTAKPLGPCEPQDRMADQVPGGIFIDGMGYRVWRDFGAGP